MLGYILGDFFTKTSGADFSNIVSAENHFPRKIPRNFLEKTIFQNFFRGKFHFFPNILGGKFSAEFSPKFSPKFSPVKNVQEIDPRSSWG
jgi:hypothetical protein